jgi:hypothetical protein
LLEERYGVTLDPVADCSPTDYVVWYANGYNSVSQRLLLDRYGHDIVAECLHEARTKPRAGHLERNEGQP